ncbi:hypothetical protein HDU85_001849 [Gaertneriomyces sp. JEL0708]|nr:hypothetical protein HDU85_001849 [Gaertneriomyces sp. JEL0708]
MKEPVMALVPLEGHSSFIHGYYGITPTYLRGTLQLVQPNPTLELTLNITFQGFSDGLTLLTLSTGGPLTLASGTHLIKWKMKLPTNPVLPPSRKVVTMFPFTRKVHQVRYKLCATVEYATNFGTAKREVSSCIDPFMVFPHPAIDEKLVNEILRPKGWRWVDVTETVQYDVTLDRTVLGVGDVFEVGWRLVMRGWAVENVRVQLWEVYFPSVPAAAGTSNAGLSLNTEGGVKRKLINWSYIKSENYDPNEDFFDRNVIQLRIPDDPRPNQSSLGGSGEVSELRHFVRVEVEVDGVEGVCLECPVTLLGVEVGEVSRILDVSRCGRDEEESDDERTVRGESSADEERSHAHNAARPQLRKTCSEPMLSLPRTVGKRRPPSVIDELGEGASISATDSSVRPETALVAAIATVPGTPIATGSTINTTETDVNQAALSEPDSYMLHSPFTTLPTSGPSSSSRPLTPPPTSPVHLSPAQQQSSNSPHPLPLLPNDPHPTPLTKLPTVHTLRTPTIHSRTTNSSTPELKQVRSEVNELRGDIAGLRGEVKDLKTELGMLIGVIGEREKLWDQRWREMNAVINQLMERVSPREQQIDIHVEDADKDRARDDFPSQIRKDYDMEDHDDEATQFTVTSFSKLDLHMNGGGTPKSESVKSFRLKPMGLGRLFGRNR